MEGECSGGEGEGGLQWRVKVGHRATAPPVKGKVASSRVASKNYDYCDYFASGGDVCLGEVCICGDSRLRSPHMVFFCSGAPDPTTLVPNNGLETKSICCPVTCNCLCCTKQRRFHHSMRTNRDIHLNFFPCRAALQALYVKIELTAS